MTFDELAWIKKRLTAAMKSDAWGTHGFGMTATPEKTGRHAAVWYGDGDQCAEVHGNLGLGIEGDAVAEFFAYSIQDVQKLVDELERTNLQVRELVELLIKRRVMEPRHSEESHECDECTVLAEMGRNREGFVIKRSDPVRKCDCGAGGVEQNAHFTGCAVFRG